MFAARTQPQLTCHVFDAISSHAPSVFDVHDAPVIRSVACGGRSYLAPSITQMIGDSARVQRVVMPWYAV